MAIIQQRERELRYGKQGNLQQEAAVSSNYLRDMIRAYGLDLKYYKLKCPYPEIFRPILDMNNLTMHAYGYDPTPEYELETPLIAYWQFSDDSLILNQYGVQPNRVAKCWIDATDFAIAFAKKLSEYKEYKIRSGSKIALEFTDLADFHESVDKIVLTFDSDVFNGDCSPVFTQEQIKYIDSLFGELPGDASSSASSVSSSYDSTADSSVNVFDSSAYSSLIPTPTPDSVVLDEPVPCIVTRRGTLRLKSPQVVPEFWKGKKYEDFIDNSFDSYIKLTVEEVVITPDKSFKLICSLSGAIIYYDLHVISKYWQQIKPDVGDVVSIPVYDRGDSLHRFEIVNIQGTKYNETYQNPFLRNYIYECDLRGYVSSGEKVPEESASEDQYRKLNEVINFAASEAGRKMSLYKDHEDNIYGGYDKVSGLDGAILAANETKGKTINKFKEREGEGEPPSDVSSESLMGDSVSLLRIADLTFPAELSLVLATNAEEDWTRLLLMKTSDALPELSNTVPWQHYLRCNDNTLVLRLDNHIYRLATLLESCPLYDDSPVIKPRRLKRSVYAQRGGWNDQPFNLVDSEESQLDLGNYAETLTGPKAGEEYRGVQIQNKGLSRLAWRNTRSYADVTLMTNAETGEEYYQLAVRFKGDRRNRRFPLATLRVD